MHCLPHPALFNLPPSLAAAYSQPQSVLSERASRTPTPSTFPPHLRLPVSNGPWLIAAQSAVCVHILEQRLNHFGAWLGLFNREGGKGWGEGGKNRGRCHVASDEAALQGQHSSRLHVLCRSRKTGCFNQRAPPALAAPCWLRKTPPVVQLLRTWSMAVAARPMRGMECMAGLLFSCRCTCRGAWSAWRALRVRMQVHVQRQAEVAHHTANQPHRATPTLLLEPTPAPSPFGPHPWHSRSARARSSPLSPFNRAPATPTLLLWPAPGPWWAGAAHAVRGCGWGTCPDTRTRNLMGEPLMELPRMGETLLAPPAPPLCDRTCHKGQVGVSMRVMWGRKG